MKNIGGMERKERPVNPLEKPMHKSGEKGPDRPKTDSSKENLLKRMRKVDPKQSERYRQRTGE